MSAPLLIVSGPPGSGKTTVGALVAARFERSAHVPGDHFFRYVVGSWQHPATPEAHEQNGHVVRVSARAAAGYAQAGYTTVLDGIYGPWFLEEIMAHTDDVELHYAVLRADLATLIDRACHRSDTPASEDVVTTMSGHFDELGQYEPFVIDTSTANPEEVTAELMSRFEAGSLRLERH